MEPQFPYVTNLNVQFDHLQVIDVPTLVSQCTHRWFNQTLTVVNDSAIRLGIVEGQYHWHKHDADDEFFFVLEGEFIIEMEKETVRLLPWQGFTVPKGVLHRPRADKKTVILMVETKYIQPTGD